MSNSKDPSKNPDKKEGKNSDLDPSHADDSKQTDKSNSDDSEVTLTEKQLQAAFQHKRFKELVKAKKERDKLLKKQQKAEESKLKEEGKLKELLEQKEKELDKLKGQVTIDKKRTAVLQAAMQLNVIDPDAVVRLIDLDNIEINDDGTPANAKDVVKELVEEKSYLLSSESKQNIGSGANPSNPTSGGKVWKLSDIRQQMKDPTWYRKHKKEIEKAQKDGRVINDNT